MKKNFTSFTLICLAISFSALPAVSQTTFQYNFNAAPTLISGTANQPGAVYRFANVSTGVDAIVSIASATEGATVDIFDDNSITKPEGFSPKIGVPRNKTGLVEFQICFVASGSMAGNIQDTLYATAIDIDGNASVKEMDVIDMGGGNSLFQVGTPEIAVSRSGTAFTGRNVAGNEYDGIDTTAKQVMFTVKNNSVGCFTYRCGAQNNGNTAVSRQKSIYFKNFTYPPPSTLPVKYLSFDAVAANKAVKLEWVTAWEVNQDHFEVERSFDRNSFKPIAIVLDGMQDADNSRTYRYKDNADEIKDRSVIYYRLKQVNLDGKINYSMVLAVKTAGNSNAVMQVSPNPFVRDMTVRFNAAVDAISEIRLLNIFGETVLSKTSAVNKGYNNIQLNDLGQLSPGMYVLQLVMNGKPIESCKVIRINK